MTRLRRAAVPARSPWAPKGALALRMPAVRARAPRWLAIGMALAGVLLGPCPVEAREAAAPLPADTLRTAADAAWAAGQTARAAALYEQVIAERSDDPVALHRLALARAWEEDHGRALELLDRLVRVAPDDLPGRVDRARALHWSGDAPAAMAALDDVLDREPHYLPALEARAELRTSEGHTDEALAVYDELLAILPETRGARLWRAFVLSWPRDLEGRVAVWDAAVDRDPDDLAVRLARAEALLYAGRPEAALEEYDWVLDRDPEQVEARRGKARAEAWAGRLVRGERLLREATDVGGGGAEALALLARNLHWQGREGAALEALEDARTVAPTDPRVRAQLRQLRSTLRPAAAPSLTFESDSEGNRMRTVSATTGWHPNPSLAMRLDAYDRRLERGVLARSSVGARIVADGELDPGWRIRVGLGGTLVDAGQAAGDLPSDPGEGGDAGPEFHPSVSLALATPARYPVGATFGMSTMTLDATAELADRAVQLSETTLAIRWQPWPRWGVEGTLGRATFTTAEENRRTSVALIATRTTRYGLTLGGSLRTFAYAEDLDEGYFDPDLYVLVEAPARWDLQSGAWSLLLEAAPGVQKVRPGSMTGSVRASGRLARSLGTGREVALAAGFSTAGLHAFANGDPGYEYRAVILSAGWSF